MTDSLIIKPVAGDDDAEWCAHLMASSEPWITLQRGLDRCQISVRRPDREIYLAWIGDDRVGFIILCMVGAFVGYIQTACIDPRWRNQGLGSHLIAFAEERIWRESPNAFLCVSSFNSRAQELYLRLGYEVIGTLSNFIVDGHDEILLRKTRGPLSTFTPTAAN